MPREVSGGEVGDQLVCAREAFPRFLGTGQWQATIYADGIPGDNPYQVPVTISTQTVTAATTLTIQMAHAGGQAIRFTPA